MTKELEALEDIILYLNASEPKGLYYENIEIIQQALQRLEAIENAKPSEALECLKKLNGMEISSMPFKDDYGIEEVDLNDIRKVGSQLNTDFREYIDTIKRYILKEQDKETGHKPSDEVISRDELCEVVDRIFGSEEKFLDIIEEDIPYGYHYYKYDDEEIYIIDTFHNRYINWYKLTHLGRDFHTDMKTKEEVIDFLQRLHDDWLKENE